MTLLAEINTADRARLLALLGGVFEHSPWVAERAAAARPFASLEALHRAMMHVVKTATPGEQLALINAHPELAGREALQGSMTADSGSEQGRLGLVSLPRPEWERITALNLRYREKFGFPCIVALKLHRTRDSVLQEMEQRLANDGDTEMANALTQIAHITHARLEKLLGVS